MSARKREVLLFLLAGLLLVAAGVITFRTVLFGDWSELCGRYDVYRAQGPYAYYLDHCLQVQHVFPLWNPLTLCGMPYAANPVTAAFYPLNLARSLLTFDPTPFKAQMGWATMMGLHLLWAGLGIYLLGRRHRLSFAAALLAAMLFCFSAIWVRRVGAYHFINMVSWLPWLMLVNIRALRAATWRQRLRLGCGAGVLLGISLLAGTMNIAPYLLCTYAAHAAFSRFLFGRADEVRALSWPRVLWGDVLYGGTAVLVGILIATVLIAPGMELAAHSGRSNDADQQLAAPHYGGSPEQLYNDLVRFPGTKFGFEDIRGFGVAGMLLAMASVFARRWRVTALWALLLLLLFDLSMGPPWPVSRLFYAMAPFQMIGSTRAFDFALIPFALLAATGLDAVCARRQARWVRAMMVFVLLAGGIVFLNTLRGLIGPDTYLAPGLWVVVIPAVAAVTMLIAPWTPGRWLWATLIPVLVFAETAVWNGKFLPDITTRKNFAKWAGVYEGNDPFWPDNRRGVDPIANRHLYALRPAMNGYEPVHLRDVRRVLAGDSRRNRYVRSVKDYEITRENHRGNLLFKRSFWLARQYVDGPLRGKDHLFPAATTVFLRDPGEIPVPRVDADDVPAVAISEAHGKRIDFLTQNALGLLKTRVRSGGEQRRLHLPAVELPPTHTALCLVFRTSTSLTLRSTFRDVEANTWQHGKRARISARRNLPATVQLPLPDYGKLVANLTFDLDTRGGEVILEDVYLLTDTADEDQRIHVLSRTANSVTVRLKDLPDTRILTFLDAAYPGWKAWLDEEPVPILVANDAFKAVVVPEGTHVVRFAYRPVRVYAGLTVSLSVLALALAGMALLRGKSAAEADTPGC